MIDKYLDFLSSYALESKLFTVIPDIYGVNKYEIMRTKKGEWSLKKVGEDDDQKILLDEKKLVEQLNEKKMDISSLEATLKRKIMTQSYYAKMCYDKTIDILGEEEIARAFEEMEAFKTNLISTIGKALKKKSLKLVKN